MPKTKDILDSYALGSENTIKCRVFIPIKLFVWRNYINWAEVQHQILRLTSNTLMNGVEVYLLYGVSNLSRKHGTCPGILHT